MEIITVTAPATTPVSVADVKTYIGVAGSGMDATISGILDTAVGLVEDHTGHALITRTVDVVSDGFPFGVSPNESDLKWSIGWPLRMPLPGHDYVQSPLVPVSAASGIYYTGTDDVEYTMDSGSYFLDTHKGRVCLSYGASWPTGLRMRDSFRMRLAVGYGASGANVPAKYRQAVLITAAHLYAGVATESSPSIPKAALELLDGGKTWQF